MKRRHIAAPILANCAYVAEIAGFVIVAQHIGIAASEIDRLFAVYSLALALTLLPAGALIDVFGARSVFLGGTWLFVLAGIALVFVDEDSQLLLARAAQGIGAGLFAPAVPILLKGSGEQTLQRYGVWNIANSAFAAVSPALVAYAAAQLSWETAWISLMSVAGLALVLGVENATSSARRSISLREFSAITPLLLIIFVGFGLNTYVLVKIPSAAESVTIAGLYLSAFWGLSILGNSIFVLGRVSVPLALALWVGLLLNILATVFLLQGALLPAALLAGLGLALMNAPSTALILRRVGTEGAGAAASLDILVARIGGALAVLLL